MPPFFGSSKNHEKSLQKKVQTQVANIRNSYANQIGLFPQIRGECTFGTLRVAPRAVQKKFLLGPGKFSGAMLNFGGFVFLNSHRNSFVCMARR